MCVLVIKLIGLGLATQALLYEIRRKPSQFIGKQFINVLPVDSQPAYKQHHISNYRKTIYNMFNDNLYNMFNDVLYYVGV